MKGLRTTNNCYGVIPKPSIACRNARVNLLELWHQRLGHANYKQVAKVSKLEAVVAFSNLEKLRRMFVVHVKWENKQSQPILK